MAYQRRRKKRSKGKRPKRGAPGGKVRVKGHTRSPRGNNAGKKAVYVKGYRRRVPNKL